MNWFKSTYTKSLEQEVERLRSENRQLVNSLLIQGGVSPLAEPNVMQPKMAKPQRRRSWYQQAQYLEAQSAAKVPSADTSEKSH